MALFGHRSALTQASVLTRRIVAITIAVVLLTAMAGSAASADERAIFHGLKDCSGFDTALKCVITQGDLRILRGAVVSYTAPVFTATTLRSPVTLVATDRRGSMATGLCTFVFAGPGAGNGHCEYWSGTGRLAGFHAAFLIGTTTMLERDGLGFVNSVVGPYWFDRHDDGDDERD
jgi:hypothetical protein